MNRRDWHQAQHFALQAIVVITFLGAFFGVVTGLYGGMRYFKQNYPQQVK
jgi:ABC-type nitrate/sulfonate/bicarbonate transport system permease component